MEEKVWTLADIGVTTLHIGYNNDRSKAVIEINRVDNDRETLSKLETLKDNFKFRPTGQKSLYEIESIETFERFYRLFCIKVEERDEPVKLPEKPAPIEEFVNLVEEVTVERLYPKDPFSLDTICATVTRTNESIAYLRYVYEVTKSGDAKFFFYIGKTFLWYYNLETVELDDKSIRLELKKSSVPIKLEMNANIKPKLDVVDSAPTTRRINSVKLNKVTRL